MQDRMHELRDRRGKQEASDDEEEMEEIALPPGEEDAEADESMQDFFDEVRTQSRARKRTE